MDPDREGYISLEEEDTSGSSHHSAILTGAAQASPTSAEDSADEIVEAGEPEEPCFVSNGSARNNRQWLGWKPAVTPFTPRPTENCKPRT